MPKTKFRVDASDLVHAAFSAACRVGSVKKGTYNQQDPTAYTEVSCWVRYEAGDPYVTKDDSYDEGPPDSCYSLRMKDVTWGMTVTLTFLDAETDKHDHRRGEKVLSFYLDHQDGEVLWTTTARVKKFLLDVVTGTAELISKPVTFKKNMTEEELAELEQIEEIAAIDLQLKRWAT